LTTDVPARSNPPHCCYPKSEFEKIKCNKWLLFDRKWIGGLLENSRLFFAAIQYFNGISKRLKLGSVAK